MFTEKTEMLIGEENLKYLKNKKICIVGIGGVGGYVVEMLARIGIENLTIIDFDSVSESNINRQIIALTSTINKPKVEVMKSRILDINPVCKVVALQEKITKENLENYNFQQFDFVIDAIDMISSKVALIEYCKAKNINIVSSMGAGNRYGIPEFEVMDIYKTTYDGLARVLRKELKKRNINALNVVVSVSQVDVKTQNIASICYQVANCGCILASFVVNYLLEEKLINGTN